jgi:hypothetical protein
LPHSNFHPELEITNDGSVIKIGGPMDKADDDCVSIVVTAYVTQPPDRRLNPAVAQQGPTGTSSVKFEHAAIALGQLEWEFTTDVEGGSLSEGWAYASAELVEKADDGAIEKYTWSQWVWLRHP